MNNFDNCNTNDLIEFVYDDIDELVPKDVSIETFIGLARECSEACDSWETGTCSSTSLEESIVDTIAIAVYHKLPYPFINHKDN